ncbi:MULTISPECIES: hypothetical protein [unclassified Streptomyces]
MKRTPAAAAAAAAVVGGILRCEEPLRAHASAAAREAERLSCGR